MNEMTIDVFEGDFPLVKWPKTESGKAYLFPFGEKLEAKKVFFTIGGNAANASVTFTRQGFKTACIAKTGNDISGEEIRRRLKKEGLRIPVILVGGFRTASRMEEHLQDASADLISLCRPLVRDPAFPSKLVQDPSLRSDCVSCNACLLTREGATRCHRPN